MIKTCELIAHVIHPGSSLDALLPPALKLSRQFVVCAEHVQQRRL
jgi:hypothetical protein